MLPTFIFKYYMIWVFLICADILFFIVLWRSYKTLGHGKDVTENLSKDFMGETFFIKSCPPSKVEMFWADKNLSLNPLLSEALCF